MSAVGTVASNARRKRAASTSTLLCWRTSMRTAALALIAAISSTPAVGGEEELHGTWKLASMQRTIVETGQTLDAFGPHPRGFLVYSEAGRMMVLIAMSNRPRPDSIEKTT